MSTPTGILFADPRAKPLSTAGQFQAGCYMCFFTTGTTTPTNVYADGLLTTPLSQPTAGSVNPSAGTVSDSAGRFSAIYLNPNTIYRVQLYSAAGSLLSDVDPYLLPGSLAGAVVSPASGVGFTINAAANSYGEVINGSSTSGQSLGLKVLAGTTSADDALLVANQAGTQDYLAVQGDGEVYIFSPTAYVAGPTNTFQAGYMDMPPNSQSGNYQLVMSDRGKVIILNGGTTFTIPANASVAFPLGTVVTFLNRTGSSVSIAITSDTLGLAGTATTGTRTLANNGICTVVKVSVSLWLAGGPGVT